MFLVDRDLATAATYSARVVNDSGSLVKSVELTVFTSRPLTARHLRHTLPFISVIDICVYILLSIWVYVCPYVCLVVCMYMSICLSTPKHTEKQTQLVSCAHVPLRLYTHVQHISEHSPLCLSLYLTHIHTHIYTLSLSHIHSRTHTHAHTHTDTYTHTHTDNHIEHTQN